MNRRELLLACAWLAVACRSQRAPVSSGRSIAITIDDPNTEETPHFTFAERNRAILEQLAARGVQAMLFVCGKRVDSVQGAGVLAAFDQAGHLLANHSYLHRNSGDAALTAEAFAADLSQCEALIAPFTGFRRRFRFPYLKEGESAAKRDALRSVLRERAYANGHVTIDCSDWAYNARLVERLSAEPAADLAPFRSAYLAHVLDRARYYDHLAGAIAGRSIAHTLLVHHNLLNALFIGELIDALAADGFRVVSPEQAYADPVFALQPSTLPAGESLVWSLAHEDARLRAGLRYPAEDETYEAAALSRL